MTEAMTLAVVRDASLLDRTRARELPSLWFPLESSVVELEVAGEARRVDRASFAVVPARASHRATAQGSVVSLVVFGVGPDARRAARREYEPDFDARAFDAIVSEPRFFPRTRWVDEIVQRYVFERTVCEKHESAAARFLETEIVKEVFFLGKEQLERKTRASVVREDGDLASRARAWLEANLFEDVSAADLARRVGASESTLLRAFRRAFGVAPTMYLRSRRLEEGLLLIESGRYTVSEVAVRVGYGNVSAFTVAFRRRFKTAPSDVKPKSGARVLPPHGRPPRPRRSRGKN